jgi:hypothetical protein
MKTQKLTCSSWLNGKHSEEIEINTKLPYVAIYGHYWQGDEADIIINDINKIYNSEDCTPLEAAKKWASNML